MKAEKTILPGSTLGMLGGGQLGGFFAEAALRLGYKVCVWDPSPNAPAKRFASISFDGGFDDKETRKQFTRLVDCVSLEWENVPASLVEILEQELRVRPGSRSLRLAQNRTLEKSFLTGQGFPVADYEVVDSKLELHNLSLPLPWIIKTATEGYDGHGQWRISDRKSIKSVLNVITGDGPWVVERIVPFMMELSVVVSISSNRNCVTYPPTENIHEDGILHISISPGRIEKSITESAQRLAREVVQSIGDSGVFCVEMFLLNNGDLIVNEIAPRPHNSGHHTIDTFSVSQYELQVRSLCDLPLVNPIRNGDSVLLNILGQEATTLLKPHVANAVMGNDYARFYFYGKESVRPGRKMGHILFTGSDNETLLKEAIETHGQISSQT
ncbi:MAG: 5-(carboxyamino)imidazole ribonucleotide synthase [SAR202 cluster bacterium]|nr:5-(carboxyamino)imidazole ribonucleotide synthase [SAR202 cluster bacterium]